MSSRRSAKVAQAILECVSSTILLELKDPRVKNVTVTGAEVSADLRSAKIRVSILGDEKTQALTLRGLESSRGFLQAKVAERLDTRYTPILKFVLDQGVKLSIETSAILRDLNLQPLNEEAHDPFWTALRCLPVRSINRPLHPTEKSARPHNTSES